MIAKPKRKLKNKKQLKKGPAGKQAQKREKSKYLASARSKTVLEKKPATIAECGPCGKSLLNRTEFHPVPKPTRNGIKQVSHKQDVREHNLSKLNHHLRKVRARGICEIPGCGSSWHMQGAHIIARSIGGKDNAGNLIEVCGDHHDHVKWSNGLPMDTQQLLNMIAEKNRACGIDRFLTGANVPAEEEYDNW
jgi:hypothetical protein